MLLHFRIQLANITKPPVWRKVSVPADYSFEDFHNIIQAAFGWEDAHLFLFAAEGHHSDPVIMMPAPDGFDSFREELDAAETKLSTIFKVENQKYTYIYDFGDDWIHHIVLEKITDEQHAKPILTAGKGACPPEDCGGPWGYAGLKETLADPTDPEHAELQEWLGLEEREGWDAAHFDLHAAQGAIHALNH